MISYSIELLTLGSPHCWPPLLPLSFHQQSHWAPPKNPIRSCEPPRPGWGSASRSWRRRRAARGSRQPSSIFCSTSRAPFGRTQRWIPVHSEAVFFYKQTRKGFRVRRNWFEILIRDWLVLFMHSSPEHIGPLLGNRIRTIWWRWWWGRRIDKTACTRHSLFEWQGSEKPCW